jgi:hypothetical protein
VHSTAEETDRLAKLLAEHNRIERARLQPRFDFVVKDCGEGEDSTECLEIWNNGEEVQTFSIFQFSFLELHRFDRPDIRYIPVYYYIERTLTNKRKGLLAVLAARTGPMAEDGYNTLRETERIASEVETGLPGTDTRMKSYLLIDYVDISDTPYSVSYDVKPGDGFFGPNTPRPLPYTVQPYWQFFTATRPLWGIHGTDIKKQWEFLLTPNKFNGALRSK